MKIRNLLVAGTAAAALGIASSAQAADDEKQSSKAEPQRVTADQHMADNQVRQAQQALRQMGHDPGPADGKMGPRTQKALKDFQQSKGIEASGELDPQTLAALDGGGSASTGSSAPSPSLPESASSGAGAPAPSTPSMQDNSTQQPSGTLNQDKSY